MNNQTPPSSTDAASPQSEQRALLQAMDSVLQPLAQLCVAKGVPIQAVEEHLRQAFVQAARTACGAGHPQRLNSRISAMTGLTRREVTRIQAQIEPARPVTRSAVTELFTHWISLPAYRGADSHPMELPRLGTAPSFEALAQAVTRDVHPRSMLDTLCRLKLAEWNEASDTVRLLHSAFVPREQWSQMLGFLGDNVGDHLRAAVVNVLGQGSEHFEQSLFADDLSTESLQKARQIISEQWRQLLTQVAPQLQTLMAADAEAGRPQDHSLRLGLYSWTQAMTGAPSPSDTPHVTSEEPEHD